MENEDDREKGNSYLNVDPVGHSSWRTLSVITERATKSTHKPHSSHVIPVGMSWQKCLSHLVSHCKYNNKIKNKVEK